MGVCLKTFAWLVVAAAFAALALAPVSSHQSPYVLDLYHRMLAPGAMHLLGTDELGRDILVRLGLGVRLSFMVGLSVVVVTGLVGIAVGLVSGYFGGWLDMLLMRVTDVFLAFPGILMAIAFAALAGPGVGNVVAALSLMGWVGFARLTRAQTLSVRAMDYVHAAELAGSSPLVIMVKHIMPNVAGPLIVEAVFAMAGAMVAEAGLSFLGIGVQPPYPSLGSMLREGVGYMLLAPHMVLAPGIVLMAMVLVLNILGDRLRDHLDKRHA